MTESLPNERIHGGSLVTLSNENGPRSTLSSSSHRHRRSLLSPSSIPSPPLFSIPPPVLLRRLLVVWLPLLGITTEVFGEETNENGNERGPNSALAHKVEVRKLQVTVG